MEAYRAGYHANDAYTAYLEMGAPKSLSTEKIAHLNEITRDSPMRDEVVSVGKDGIVNIIVPMQSNDIVLLKLRRGDS